MLQEAVQTAQNKPGAVKSQTGSPYEVAKGKLDLYVSETADIFIFHTHPFDDEVSWVEYDMEKGDLNLIQADGDIRNFGVRVPNEFSAYVQNTYSVNLVLVKNNEAVDTVEVPLIMHQL